MKDTNLRYTVVERQVSVYRAASIKVTETPIIEKEEIEQQENTIIGRITDRNGEAIIGANILENGTTNGTVTDVDGNFTLSVGNDAILHISYIGYLTQDIETIGRTSFDIILQEDLQSLDELVVVGYGVQKKVNLTGAVASVKVDESLAGRPLTNAAIGLQGVLPGLAVTQSSGMAGQNDINLAIRGLGTVNNSNLLVVVDGMPDVDINRLNINDIENISVLKDAASAAVYGSRGANGVILITTRSGKDQTRNKVTVSSSYAIGKAASDVYPIMNDYARALTSHQQLEAVGRLPESFTFRNGTIDQWMAMGWIDPFLFPNTDWWDITMRDGMVRKNNASISGSTDRFVLFFSVGMVDEEGLQIRHYIQ